MEGLGLLLTLTAVGAQPSPPGVSARFTNRVAVWGQPVTVELWVVDPAESVSSAVFTLRTDRGSWRPQAGIKGPGGTWSTTFERAHVWASSGEAPAQPLTLGVRAELFGRRGGLILTVGDSPFEMDVLTAKQAARRARLLSVRAGPGPGTRFNGYLGVEGRAGSAARARVYFGLGMQAGSKWEWIPLTVSVGPSFAAPTGTRGGGPFTLGFQTAVRRYVTGSPSAWKPFIAPFAEADLRFAGLDMAAGIRTGLVAPFGARVPVEAALFGAVAWFSAIPPEGRADQRSSGFTGGVRVGFRLGTRRKDDPP